MSANDAHPLTPFLATSLVVLLLALAQPASAEPDCPYGPPNLLRSKTPFSSSENADGSTQGPVSEFESISLSKNTRTSTSQNSSNLASRLSLKERLIPARMFLPERMTIGASAKFTVKAKPGMKIAIAMADRNEGAKPIQGKNVRLGPDRKVVAVSRVNESGIAEIYVETPIEGDLIGQYLYFEAALWNKDDMSDAELADTVTPADAKAPVNGVMVAQVSEKKRGVRIVPDGAMPILLRAPTSSSLGAGQP